MDKLIGSLIWLVIAVLEVNLLIVAYILGIVYLTYMSFRGKRQFKTTFINLSKEFINDIGFVLSEHRNLVMGV